MSIIIIILFPEMLIHKHTYTCTHTHIHMYVYIYIYIYIYIYKGTNLVEVERVD